MTTYNAWGEPQPAKLTGPLGRAWARIMYANEFFDGEEGIQHGAQQRLIREWNENAPSRVHMYDYRTQQDTTRDFPTRREAEAYADALDSFDEGMVTVSRLVIR